LVPNQEGGVINANHLKGDPKKKVTKLRNAKRQAVCFENEKSISDTP